MNGWIKTPIVGDKIVGADHLVYSGKVSWRATTTQLRSASLSHNELMVKINGYGEYWQADDFELSLNQKKPTLLRRRISKRIESDDIGIVIEEGAGHLYLSITKSRGLNVNKFLSPENCGCWLNVEIVPREQKLHYYITKDRI